SRTRTRTSSGSTSCRAPSWPISAARRSRPRPARWSTSRPTWCTAARRRPTPTWCSSRSRTPRTACTASRRRELPHTLSRHAPRKRGIQQPRKPRWLLDCPLARAMTRERKSQSMNIQSAAVEAAHRLIVDRDVDVPMRDGARLKADVIRPDDGGRFPAILNHGPYQKDKVRVAPDTLEEKPNPLMNWETVNPEWWVPRGYACLRVDGRGSGKSPGQCEPWSLQEAIDFYDAIEWAAAQPWC